MNRGVSCVAVSLVLLAVGCSGIKLKPTLTCQPLSSFDTFVIAPFDGATTIVEEERYKSLPTSLAVATTDSLKMQIENSRLFKAVVQASDCSERPERAVKLDGKIYSLIHDDRKFHVGVRGQIVDCKTGQTLFNFESENEKDSETSKVAKQIAEKLAKSIGEGPDCR